MKSDYVFSLKNEDVFHEFYNMPENLLAVEIVGMKDVLNSLSELDSRLLDSYAFDCIAELLEIARHALTLRFIHNHASFDSEDSKSILVDRDS